MPSRNRNNGQTPLTTAKAIATALQHQWSTSGTKAHIGCALGPPFIFWDSITAGASLHDGLHSILPLGDQTVTLRAGGKRHGLIHIIFRHIKDFRNACGINSHEIAEFILDYIVQGNILYRGDGAFWFPLEWVDIAGRFTWLVVVVEAGYGCFMVKTAYPAAEKKVLRDVFSGRISEVEKKIPRLERKRPRVEQKRRMDENLGARRGKN